MKGTTSSNAGTLRAVALSVAVFGCVSAAAAQEQQKLFIEGDIVRGNTPSGNTGPVCVLANEFKRKENVIFRIRVRNPMGQALDDEGLKSLIVELSDGKKIPAEYRARPPVAVRARLGLTGPIDYFWSSAWLIPADYPTVALRDPRCQIVEGLDNAAKLIGIQHVGHGRAGSGLVPQYALEISLVLGD
jgi:hypothetical protein